MHRMTFPSALRTLLFLPLLAVLAGCEKELDSPTPRTIPTGQVYTIQDLKNMYDTIGDVRFTGDASVYATVINDELDGNFYKNIYVQDATGGICLRLLNSGGLYVGDSIRIYLPGTVCRPYQNLMQLDSVSVDNNVVKQATQRYVQPRPVTIDQITPDLQSTLILLYDSVEFISDEAVGSTWATPGGSSSTNRTIEDCNGNQILVRSSDYSNYAAQALPQGRGPMVAVVGVFGSTLQLYNRSLSEVHMTGPRCVGQELPFFSKNFNDASVTSGGWSQWSDTTVFWTTNTVGSNDGTPYGQIKNYVNGANIPCETWLISPSINLTSISAPILSFITGCNYTGSNLQVFVSTDYASGAPSSATWTSLPAAVSAGAWAWTPSGALSLSSFISSNVHIGFKYTGTSSDGKTWELDDVKILAQ